MKIFNILLSTAVFGLLAASCSGDPKFKIDGEVTGAAGQPLILEKSDFHGRWIAVDSTRISDSGKFSIEGAAPLRPRFTVSRLATVSSISQSIRSRR